MERVFMFLQSYFDIVFSFVSNELGLVMTKYDELCSEILLFVCFCKCSAYMVLMIFLLKTEISKGDKRRKIHFEGEDSDSTANSVTKKHDVSKKKKEKATSRFVNDSDPFDIPKLQQELDTSPFGSLTKEIEVLFSRRSRLPNYEVALNHRLHNKCSEVPKNHCKEPSKLVNQQVTHEAHQNAINLEPFNGGTAIAPTVIYISSSDDDGAFESRIYSAPKVNDLSSSDGEIEPWIYSAPTVKDLSSDNEVRGQETSSPPTIIDLQSNDEDNGQGMHSHILQRVVSEPVGALLMKDSMVSLFLHM
jgi:hypothetical protein